MYQAKTRKNLVVTESNEIKDGNADGAEVNRDELKQQILIVDDAELNRDILAEILHHDFKTMEVSSGEEYLSVLREYGAGISLVLLDIVMPGMDGFAVLEAMNRNHWIDDIPVIMISSEETESYIRRRMKWEFQTISAARLMPRLFTGVYIILLNYTQNRGA